MNPKVISATLLYRTTLRGYTFDFLGNIKTPGRIQYSYILAALNEAMQPIMYVCSEWSSSSGEVPPPTRFLGLFRQGARLNLGESTDWAKSNLFVLRAMRISREEIQAPLKDYELTDLEAIALNEILKELQAGKSDGANNLWSHIRDYDAAIASFLTDNIQKRN